MTGIQEDYSMSPTALRGQGWMWPCHEVHVDKIPDREPTVPTRSGGLSTSNPDPNQSMEPTMVGQAVNVGRQSSYNV